MGNRLPIVWVRGAPFVQVTLNGEPMLALIDTGADHVYLDPAVIDRLIMATIRFGDVSAANNTTRNNRVVRAHLAFPEAEVKFALDGYEVGLHSTGREYGLLLGRSFLALGILHLDYIAGDHWFEFGPI